ncbi:MAG: helix-hairpin-helix domain-containing protein [Acidobacteriota bacterium]|nr:helix-hairpin-helix domain-containing protein [Acidobacteriota bacterium]
MRHSRMKKMALGTALMIFLFSFSGLYAQTKAPAGKLNINTASAAELQNLPRIGPKVAQRIVDYRTANGNFKKIEEIMKVNGIGEKVFAQIKDLITVGPESHAK